MKFAPYAFSKVSSYLHCPRKFKYIYIDKIKTKTDVDMTALHKGRAVHDMLEKYPEPSNAYLADKYKYIVDSFIKTDLGKKYLSCDSIREMSFGISKTLQETTYRDKTALYRGKIDHICTIEEFEYEIIEVDNLNDIDDEYEIIEVIE